MFVVVGLIVVFLGIKNFKNGLLALLLYKIVLNMYINVIAIPGMPLLSVDLCLTIIYIFLYIIRRKSYKKANDFPFFKPFVFLFFSWLLSTIFAISGMSTALSEFVKDVSQQLIFIYIIWCVFDRKKDYNIFLKGIIIIFCISCLYCFYETYTKTNPLMDYELSLSGDEGRFQHKGYAEESGRGYRSRSFFEHAIGAGTNWGMFIIFILNLILYYKQKIPLYALALLTTFLSFFCLLFTNSRGPILFLLLGSLSFVRINKTFMLKFVPFFMIAILVMFFLGGEFLNDYYANFLSIFDRSGKVDVGGSDEETRLVQTAASLKLLTHSPLYGLGYKFMDTINDSAVDDLFGLESMWFKIITYFGLLGIMSNIYFAYYSIIKIPKVYNSKPAAVLALSYWIVGSLTSLPGFLFHLYFMIYFYYIKFNTFPVRQ